jgi:hypothetical protein
VIDPVRTIARRRPSGWPVAMQLVPLDGDALLVHSPTWVGDDTFAQVAAFGTPRVLFAPNHYHHLSIRRFRERWPDASVVASPTAIPRLRKLGHVGLCSVTDQPLPARMRWLLPEGTRSGEAWLELDSDPGPTWIVCDAVFHETRPVKGLEGLFLRLSRATPGLAMGKTFTVACLSDRAKYRAWVLEAVARSRPWRMLFSHGQALEGPDLSGALAELIRARLA